MDDASEKKLAGVHPVLVRIFEATIQTPQPFGVIYGLRSPEAEAIAVKTHHSQTLHSRHEPNKQGFGCAVDVDCIVGGKLDPTFAKGKEEQVFSVIAKQVRDAVAKLGLPENTIQWGGDKIGAWTLGKISGFRDWDHFQLPWELYP